MYTFLERECDKEHIGNLKFWSKITKFQKKKYTARVFFLPLLVQNKLKIDKKSKY